MVVILSSLTQWINDISLTTHQSSLLTLFVDMSRVLILSPDQELICSCLIQFPFNSLKAGLILKQSLLIVPDALWHMVRKQLCGVCFLSTLCGF